MMTSQMEHRSRLLDVAGPKKATGQAPPPALWLFEGFFPSTRTRFIRLLYNGFIVLIVQSVSVEIYENRDKSRKSTKFGIHVLEGI